MSTKFTESLQKLLGQTAGKGAAAGVKTSGVLYGFEKAIHAGAGKAGGAESEILQASQKIKPDYSNIQF